MELSEIEVVKSLDISNIQTIISFLSNIPYKSEMYQEFEFRAKKTSNGEIFIGIIIDNNIVGTLGSVKDKSGYYMMKNAYVDPTYRNHSPNLLALMIKYLAKEIIKDSIIADFEMTPEAIGSWKKLMAANIVNLWIWDRDNKTKIAYHPNRQPVYYDPLNVLRNINDVGLNLSDKHRFVWLVESGDHLYEGLIDPRRHIKYFDIII